MLLLLLENVGGVSLKWVSVSFKYLISENMKKIVGWHRTSNGNGSIWPVRRRRRILLLSSPKRSSVVGLLRQISQLVTAALGPRTGPGCHPRCTAGMTAIGPSTPYVVSPGLPQSSCEPTTFHLYLWVYSGFRKCIVSVRHV